MPLSRAGLFRELTDQRQRHPDPAHGHSVRRNVITLLLALQRASSDSAAIATALRTAIEMPAHREMRWGNIRDVQNGVRDAYASHAWQPFWVEHDRITRSAQRLIDDLDSAAVRGLDPDDYDVDLLHRTAASVSPGDVQSITSFDLLLSVAATRFAKDLAEGRADPATLHPLLHIEHPVRDDWSLLGRLARAGQPDSMLHLLEPRHGTYQLLLDQLASYRHASVKGDSARRRIRQIELALERWRWLPHEATAPWVLINIPAFRLYAVGNDDGTPEGQEVLQMEVVDGRAAGHPTPLLVTRIVAVQFHPPWIVPPTIARKELKPQALRDMAFLAREHYQLFRNDTAVAAQRETVAHMGDQVEVRQSPGPWNALGSVKFVTPNTADIYLHDTPEQDGFQKDRRDLSHGCIRLERPIALTNFVLRGEVGWDADRVAAELAGNDTRTVVLLRPIPVFVVYQTLVPAAGGGLLVYRDIYGLDRRLDELMRAPYASSTSVPTEKISVYNLLHTEEHAHDR